MGHGREGTLRASAFEWVYIIRSILSRAYIVRLLEPPLRPFPAILCRFPTPVFAVNPFGDCIAAMFYLLRSSWQLRRLADDLPFRPFPAILFGLLPCIGSTDKLFFLFKSLKAFYSTEYAIYWQNYPIVYYQGVLQAKHVKCEV